MSERIEGRRSPLTGEVVSFVVSVSTPKLRLQLESEDQLNRNALLDFKQLQRPNEASPIQLLVFLLLDFNGWSHNGGFGHGFEVLEDTGDSKEDLLEMMSMVGAHRHREAVEAHNERAYYQLRPDLPGILAAFARQNLEEFAVIITPQSS